MVAPQQPLPGPLLPFPEVESQLPFSKPVALLNSRGFLETASLLIIWSLLVINEGSIRLIGTDPAAGLSGGRPPTLLLFLAALSEVGFGLLGLILGLAAFVLRRHNPTITKAAIIIQTALGYFVFAVFVFIVPALKAAELKKPVLDGLSLGQSRFLVTLGILTSFHFCLALQGGQFVFMARLIAAGTGADFLKQHSGLRMRALFWNANMLLAGLWTLATGLLVSVNVGGGKIEKAFFSPPNVGRLPAMTVWTGLLMVVWAITGMVVAGARLPVPRLYYGGAVYVYISVFLNFTIVQFGLIEEAPSGGVAMHAGLVFMVTFLGPYFVHLHDQSRTE